MPIQKYSTRLLALSDDQLQGLDAMTVLDLGTVDNAFARGGNRLCFIDPRDSRHCIKVARQDRTPEIKKSLKKFPANLKPLRAFDDNDEEFRVYQHIERQIGDEAFQLIPRCYGFVESNFGRGLCSEIIKDSDSRISLTLKHYVWELGLTAELQDALDSFQQQWQSLGMPSRNLLLHNIVVQQVDAGIERLVVIDGLGWPDILPLGYYFRSIARRKATRKASRLGNMLDKLIATRNSGGDWGYHGWLTDKQRTADSDADSSPDKEHY